MDAGIERGKRFLERYGTRPPQNTLDDYGDLGRYMVGFVFGDVFQRPVLSERDREIATLAMLMSLRGDADGLDSHIRIALNMGLSVEAIQEICIQVAAFAGIGAGS